MTLSTGSGSNEPELGHLGQLADVNYTNFCVTDCDFCAFYRRPMDPEGYVLPKPVIFRKIEETLDLGGTALLLQGGHHPTCGSSGTRTSSARSSRATRSTCTRCRRRRSTTSRGARG